MEGLTNGFIQWMRPLNRLEDFELDKREPNQSKEARFIDIFRNAWNNACLLYTSINYASRYFYNASISAFISRKGASSFVQSLSEKTPQVAPAIE